MSGFSVFGRHYPPGHPWNGSWCCLKYLGKYHLNQSMQYLQTIYLLFPNPWFPNYALHLKLSVHWLICMFWVWLCVLCHLFIYLDPLTYRFWQNAPLCHTYDTSPLVPYTLLSCDCSLSFYIWIDHYYQTAFLLYWWMLLPWCWMFVHSLVILHKTHLSQNIMLACAGLLVFGLSALLSFGLLPQYISLTSTLPPQYLCLQPA